MEEVLQWIHDNPYSFTMGLIAFIAAGAAVLSAVLAWRAWNKSKKDSAEAKASADRAATALEDANKIYGKMNKHLKGNALATKEISETEIRRIKLEIYRDIKFLLHIVNKGTNFHSDKTRFSIFLHETEYLKYLGSLEIAKHYFDVTDKDSADAIYINLSNYIYNLFNRMSEEYDNDHIILQFLWINSDGKRINGALRDALKKLISNLEKQIHSETLENPKPPSPPSLPSDPTEDVLPESNLPET